MMSRDDIKLALDARIVAEALQDGDIDGLVELDSLLRASCTDAKVAAFMVQLVFELLTDEARAAMEAAAGETAPSNVIDLFTRRPREEE